VGNVEEDGEEEAGWMAEIKLETNNEMYINIYRQLNRRIKRLGKRY
jgi:hypothetical protein